MRKTIDVLALVTDESAVVEVTGPQVGTVETVTATGWSKKHPDDDPDETVGFNVAVSRALRALADKYDEAATEALQEAEDSNFLTTLFKQPTHTVTFTGKLSPQAYTALGYTEDDYKW